MVERILELINQSGLCDYAFERQLGFAQGTIGNWRHNKNKLSSEAIIKIARYFNLSADYLLCLTDAPTPLKKSAYDGKAIIISKDNDFLNSTKLYNCMSQDCKKQVNTFILGVATGSGLNIKKIIKK